jgi:hypothetical protein
MEITPTGAAARPAATGLPPVDRAQIVNAAEPIR